MNVAIPTHLFWFLGLIIAITALPGWAVGRGGDVKETAENRNQ